MDQRIPDEARAGLVAQGIDPDKAEECAQAAFPLEAVYKVDAFDVMVCELCGALVLAHMRYTHAVWHAIAAQALTTARLASLF